MPNEPDFNFTPASQRPAELTGITFWFHFWQGRLILGDEPTRVPQQRLPGSDEAHAHYIGRLGEFDCLALALTEAPPDSWQAVPLRQGMMGLPPELAAAAGRAAQVVEWDRSHRFCGACGQPTERKPHEYCRVCTACGQSAYPRISPAMMALVVRGRELLLARSPNFPPGRYSALAGFVEPGESLEQCVAREVQEEVGLKIKQLRYFGSQPWPFPHSLMLAFTAEYDSGDITPQPGEIEDARWFDIDALPELPPPFSISGRLIAATIARLRQSDNPEPA